MPDDSASALKCVSFCSWFSAKWFVIFLASSIFFKSKILRNTTTPLPKRSSSNTFCLSEYFGPPVTKHAFLKSNCDQIYQLENGKLEQFS